MTNVKTNTNTNIEIKRQDNGLAVAIIDLDALIHNATVLRQYAPQSKILAVVKANAYGHHSIQCAQILSNRFLIDGFAVARIDEAIALRQSGIMDKILVLGGIVAPQQLQKVVHYRLDLVIFNEQQIEWMADFLGDHQNRIQVWVKIDTGMHRVGFYPEQVPDVLNRLLEIESVSTEINFLSHLACADEIGHPLTLQQKELFNQVIVKNNALQINNKAEYSLAASAGIMAHIDAHYQWTRPGISLYGISPFSGKLGSDFNLKAVMTLTSRLLSIKQIKAGQSVGYGATWIAPHDTLIGVVAMGYGDGYNRCAPEGTPVLVNGREVPLVGRVSMDTLTVDLGAMAGDKVGDPVELWGTQLPVERVAQWLNTIPYELVTRLTQRIKYQFINKL